MDAIEELRRKHPWPDARPPLPDDWHGWLREQTAYQLRLHCGPTTRTIVECGTWLGVSTRHLLCHAPRATVICLDTWQGSADITDPAAVARIPRLMPQCRANLWPWRDRAVLIRGDSLPTLRDLAALHVEPDLLYLDSAHTFHQAAAELLLCCTFWPRTPIVGDDVWMPEVRAAAQLAAEIFRRRFTDHEHCYTLEHADQ